MLRQCWFGWLASRVAFVIHIVPLCGRRQIQQLRRKSSFYFIPQKAHLSSLVYPSRSTHATNGLSFRWRWINDSVWLDWNGSTQQALHTKRRSVDSKNKRVKEKRKRTTNNPSIPLPSVLLLHSGSVMLQPISQLPRAERQSRKKTGRRFPVHHRAARRLGPAIVADLELQFSLIGLWNWAVGVSQPGHPRRHM